MKKRVDMIQTMMAYMIGSMYLLVKWITRWIVLLWPYVALIYMILELLNRVR